MLRSCNSGRLGSLLDVSFSSSFLLSDLSWFNLRLKNQNSPPIEAMSGTPREMPTASPMVRDLAESVDVEGDKLWEAAAPADATEVVNVDESCEVLVAV